MVSLIEGWLRQIKWIFGKFTKGKGGGGAFSIQKFMLQILGILNRAFWAWNWYPLPRRMVPISGNHVPAFHAIWPSYPLAFIRPNPLKNLSHNFRKMRGDRKPLGIFRNFIRFGAAIHPLGFQLETRKIRTLLVLSILLALEGFEMHHISGSHSRPPHPHKNPP